MRGPAADIDSRREARTLVSRGVDVEGPRRACRALTQNLTKGRRLRRRHRGFQDFQRRHDDCSRHRLGRNWSGEAVFMSEIALWVRRTSVALTVVGLVAATGTSWAKHGAGEVEAPEAPTIPDPAVAPEPPAPPANNPPAPEPPAPPANNPPAPEPPPAPVADPPAPP